MVSGPFRLAPRVCTVYAIALRLLDGFLISQKIRKLEVKLLKMVLEARVRICPNFFLQAAEMSENVRKCPKMSENIRNWTFFKIDVWKNLTAQFRAAHAETMLHRSTLKIHRTKSSEFCRRVLFLIEKSPKMSENVRKSRFGHSRTSWPRGGTFGHIRTSAATVSSRLFKRATQTCRIFWEIKNRFITSRSIAKR